MKFTVGPIPEDPDFRPQAEQWTMVREPTPGKMLLTSVSLAVFLGLATVVLWILLTPVDVDEIQVLWSIAVLPLCVPFHEIAHALGFPLTGWFARTCFGIWPSKCAFYAHYQGSLSRGRVLAVLFLPIALITILPLGLCSISQSVPPVVMYASIGNVYLSSVDIVTAGLVRRQLPSNAVFRQQGLTAWWMTASASHVGHA